MDGHHHLHHLVQVHGQGHAHILDTGGGQGHAHILDARRGQGLVQYQGRDILVGAQGHCHQIEVHGQDVGGQIMVAGIGTVAMVVAGIEL